MNKYRITFTILLVAFWNCMIFSQCELIPEIVSNYHRQVAILALEDMVRSGTSDTNSIRITDEYTTPVFESLGAIYTSVYTQEADSVFNIYCINNSGVDEQGGYSATTIYVELDTTVSWTSSWLNEIPSSGNNYIDSLLEGFEYEVELFVPFLLDGVVKIAFAEIINLPLLVRLLNLENGVIYAERVPAIGDRDHITYSREGDIQYVDFHLGWDDCFSGCISNRIWQFEVYPEDCYVEYLGAYGRPVTFWYNGPPAALNCNLSISTDYTFVNESLKLHPNPVIDYLKIEAGHTIQHIEIYDLFGRSVYFQSLLDQSSQLDISFLMPGIYFAKVDDQFVKKFVKE